MNHLILAFVGLLGISPVAHSLEVVVDRVIDGDTFQVIVKEHPVPLQQVSVRILHLDTPETHGKCVLEQNRAKTAKAFLKDLLPPGTRVDLDDIRFDKYGGRILAVVTLNGQVVADLVKEKKLGADYEGVGPKPAWCDPNFQK